MFAYTRQQAGIQTAVASTGHHQRAARTGRSLAAAELHKLLGICLPYFHLTDVVRLSTSSRLLAQLCREQLTADHNHLALQLLQQAVEKHAAAGAESSSKSPSMAHQRDQQARLVSAVTWVLDTLGSVPLFSQQKQQQQNSSAAAAETTTASMLVQHCSPLIKVRLAKRLVRNGMRVSYAQLIAAARAGVPGIEVWGQAYQQLRMESDVPEYARPFAVCSIMRMLEWVPPTGITPTELADYIFLAGNSLTVKNMKKLAFGAMSFAIGRHPVSEQIAVADINSLLKMVARNVGDSAQRTEFHAELGALPEARNITLEMITEPGGLLETAMKYKDHLLLHVILGGPASRAVKEHVFLHVRSGGRPIPAVRELDSGILVNMLKSVVAAAPKNVAARSGDKSFGREPAAIRLSRELVSCPAAQQISGDAAFELLQLALSIKNEGVFLKLMGLPAVERLSHHKMRQLIDKVVELKWDSTELDLVSFPNALPREAYEFLLG